MNQVRGIPCIHAVVNVSSVGQALADVATALGGGLDGVFLISHDADDGMLLDAVAAVKADWSDAFLGVNFVRRTGAEAVRVLHGASASSRVDAIWSDNAGSDVDALAKNHLDLERARRDGDWRGLHFGGVAFKYQEAVRDEDLGELTSNAARYVDVVTTSGTKTGSPIATEKLATMRDALGEHPLALASGVTPGNVHMVRDLVEHILVSTGIKKDDGGFDDQRIRRLRLAVSGATGVGRA